MVELQVEGPWSLATSRSFWEGFAPAALAPGGDEGLSTVFLVEADWSRAAATVRQDGGTASVVVSGAGDLDAAAAQVARFLALDVDAREWPAVGQRDPVLGEVQAMLPGLRPCGFHSPYEAAVWAVLSQRIRVPQAAKLRAQLTDRYGDDGALPTPSVLRGLDLELPGRKAEYLQAVADAALDGVLDGPSLRGIPPEEAVERVQQVKGVGPFAAELVVVRGANAPDAVPHHEARLDDEIRVRYGDDATVASVSEAWRPFRTWAAVHLRAAREARLHEFD